MSTRIFVGNLAAGITRTDLFQLFRKHGGLQSLSFPVDPSVGDGKEFALIEMTHEWEARAAMAALNKTQLMGRPIAVREARNREYHHSPG